MKHLNKLKWWLIYHLLNSNERSILLISLNPKSDNLERYSDCIGETYHEYVEETSKFKHNYEKRLQISNFTKNFRRNGKTTMACKTKKKN